MKNVVRNSLLVGCDLAEKIVNDVFGEPKRYSQRVSCRQYDRHKPEVQWSEKDIIFDTSEEANNIIEKMVTIDPNLTKKEEHHG